MMPLQESDNKRIAKNTLLLYGRMIFVMGVSLFTSRIILKSLGVEDFGIYNVVGGVVALFAVFSNGVTSAISRFITFELGKGNQQKLKAIFSTSINIQILLSILIATLAEIFGVWFLNNKMQIPLDRINAAYWVMQCSIATFIIGLISAPYNAAIVAHEKMSTFAYISIFDVSAKLGIAYFIYISPYDKLICYAVLLLLLATTQRLIYGFYCRKNFDECKFQFIFDRSLLKEMFSYAGWTMIGLVANVGYTQGLNVILNLFFGPAINAARGIAVQVQNAVIGFSNNFQMALNPQIIKSYAKKDFERMHTLIFASSKYCFFLLFFLSLPIIIETPKILEFWLGEYPDHTVSFIRLLMVVITLDSLGGSISCAQQASGKIKTYQIVVGGIMLLIVPISFFVLKAGGMPESVYVVYLIAVIIAHISRMFIIRNMINLSFTRYMKKVLIPICKVLISSIWVPVIIYQSIPNNVLGFLATCIASFLSVGLSIYLLGIGEQERLLVNNKVKIIFSKVKANV